ncbi:hypothetical protein GN956_G7727 [Arapaima gigas]
MRPHSLLDSLGGTVLTTGMEVLCLLGNSWEEQGVRAPRPPVAFPEKEALSHQEAVKKLEESWRWRLEELRMQMEVQVEHTEAQLALREQELRRKLAEELRLEKEKNEKLKLKHQQETEELQQRLPSLVQAATRDAEERALLLERRLREARDTLAEQEEQEAARRSALQTELQRVRYREQQGALQLDHMRRETWELQEQNALLQETVRRECEEREELTAALTLAREQLLERRSSRTPPTGTGHRRDPRGPQGSPIAATRPPLVLPRLPKASEACNRSFKLVYRNKWRKRRPAAFKPEAQVAAGKRRRGRTRGSGGSGCRQVAPPLPVGKKPPSGRRRARPAAATSSWSG